MEGRINPYSNEMPIQEVWFKHHQVLGVLAKMPLIPTEKIMLNGGEPAARTLYVRNPDIQPSSKHVLSVHKQLDQYVRFHNLRLNAAETQLQRTEKAWRASVKRSGDSNGDTKTQKAFLHATKRRDEIRWDRDAAMIEFEMGAKTNYFPHVKSEVIKRLEEAIWQKYFVDAQRAQQK